MARHEGRFLGQDAQALSLDELLNLLDRDCAIDAIARRDAIACYLAGGDGWREALKHLGGAFAGGLPELTDPKGE